MGTKSINFTYDFSKDEVRSLNEAIVTEIVKSPILQTVFGRIETGIKNDRAIGFVNTAIGKMLKAPQVVILLGRLLAACQLLRKFGRLRVLLLEKKSAKPTFQVRLYNTCLIVATLEPVLITFLQVNGPGMILMDLS